MEYKRQDKELLEINEIKNLEAINLTNLMHKNDNIPVLIVTYDNGKKTLCYTSLDKYFIYFFEMVRRVYNEEKTTRRIFIEPLVANFLKESAINIKEIIKDIGECKTKTKKINYKIKENEMYYKILKYILEDLLKFLNKDLKITDIKGINKTFSLIGVLDGLNKIFPFKVKTENNKTTFIFPGMINGYEELIIEIEESDNLTINFFDRRHKLHGNITYNINEERGQSISTLYHEGKCIFKNIEDLESPSEEYCAIFNLMKISGVAYILPWGDIRLINKKAQTEDGLTSIFVEIIDFKINKDNTHAKIIRKSTNTLTTEIYKDLELDGTLKVTTLKEESVTNLYFINGEVKYIIRETSFEDSTLGRGLYKSWLANNHFYKIYKISGTNLLDMKIESEANINENVAGYQLLDEFELKLLLRRGGNNGII